MIPDDYEDEYQVPVGEIDRRSPTECRICGELSSGLHYGVISCEGCKRFFRRCQLSGRQLFCAMYNNCNILGRENRNSCASCRFQKCLIEGMVCEDRKAPIKKVPDIDEPGPSSSSCESSSSSSDSSFSSFDNSYSSHSRAPSLSPPLVVPSLQMPAGGEYGSSDSDDSETGENTLSPPSDTQKKLVAVLQATLHWSCDPLLDVNFSKARHMKHFFSASRMEVWESISEDMVTVCYSVMRFALSIHEFNKRPDLEMLRLMSGSVLPMAVFVLARGFSYELGQLHIGNSCYPPPKLVVSKNELQASKELQFLDRLYSTIIDVCSLKLNPSQLSIILAITLFEGGGILNEHLRATLIYFVPTQCYFLAVLETLDKVKTLYQEFTGLLEEFLEEVPNANVPNLFKEFLLVRGRLESR